MKRGNIVYHKKHLGIPLRVVAPAESNGNLKLVCETFDSLKLAVVIIEDRPENFYI